ncbi:alpha-amylase [Candidatus Nitronereus thalassa]|uniref:alpha-amylase n=1 Tax=Candidatus Nitronereus thalassa TaxID=3020898 RepID=UPI003B968F5B
MAGSCDRWGEHAARAVSMGFNWIYINPVNAPGFSGSLYSTKEYEQLNTAFVPPTAASQSLDVLKPALQHMVELGLHPMIDLVINHTAIDSPLIHRHPAWFQRDADGQVINPCAVDPNDPTKKTVWGDLAIVDNEESSDREGLWRYWTELVLHYLALGFQGFRCDAAYQVPAKLWQRLIQEARNVNPNAVFWAENLGCTVEQTRALRAAGFQYFCNSSKWWNFQDDWCLAQHREFEDMPSISFPETHDTDRLAQETHGLEKIQRQRYAFATTFSAGIMMPIGYEFGFQKRLHVVETQPSDWESGTMELQKFIHAVNDIKMNTPLLQGEGTLNRLFVNHPSLLVLARESEHAPGQRGWIVLNRDWDHSAQLLIHELQLDGKITWRDLTKADQHHPESHDGGFLEIQPAGVLFLSKTS